MSYFRKLGLLLGKDVKCLWRDRGSLVLTGGLALVLVVLATFAFRRIGMTHEELLSLTPGALCLVFLFSSVTLLTSSFVSEREDQAMFGLFLAGYPSELIFLSKCLVNWCAVSLLFAVVLGAYVLFAGLEFNAGTGSVLGIWWLVAVGFVALGTLLSAISVHQRRRDVLLPLLQFPLCIPVFGAALGLSRRAFLGEALAYGEFSFILLCGFGVVSLALGLLLFDFSIQE